MDLPTYFKDFLRDIRLTENQTKDCITGHRTLRQRLEQYEDLAPFIVSTFLQGSYRRATAVRPHKGKRADVDVIVVTKLSEEVYSPDAAIQLFVPFLDEYYPDKYEIQGRSLGIFLSYVDLDLVITSAPSESEMDLLKAAAVTAEDTLEGADDWRLVESWIPSGERSAWNAQFLLKAAQKEAEWQLSPLRIPDREAKCWQSTHPLAQMQWTRDKNRRCNGHYVNVVKAIKWWRRVMHPDQKYPKGYPVEHIVGECCPDGITSVAEGVTRTLEIIVSTYGADASEEQTPFLSDHGVPEHNVFGRVSGKDFAAFYAQVCAAAKIARAALDVEGVVESVRGWKKLFDDKFPDAPPGDNDNDGNGDDSPKLGYTPREERSKIKTERFA